MMKQPVVIYIAGYGRSGSSALSRALAQDETVLSAGELGRLPKIIRNDQSCSCSETVSKCPVWRNAKTGTIDDAMTAVTQAKFSIVVDSSKTSYCDFHRPLLYRSKGYRVILVHLHRPLAGVLDSVRKGTNKDLEAGNGRLRAFNPTRTVIGYIFAHCIAEVYKWIFKESVRVEQSAMLLDIASERYRILESAKDVHTRKACTQIAPRTWHGMHEIAGNRLLRRGGDE